MPEDCGRTGDPGILDLPEYHDWSNRETTPDQQRIERYIAGFDLRSKRLLHIGAGNSRLARRFARRAGEIVGTTREADELLAPKAWSIPNYTIVLQNKYAARPELTPGTFDFIIDNNPASYCCCMSHLFALFEFYRRKLAPGGQIITDRLGLSWVAPAGIEEFRMDFEDLRQVASAAGFTPFSSGRHTFVLTTGGLPMRPGILRMPLGHLAWTASHARRKSIQLAKGLNARLQSSPRD